MVKRVVAIGDLHCGHMVGLTPPDWQYHPAGKRVQAEMWDFYAETLRTLKPIDLLIVNGDAIDGRGEASGGTELISPDPQEQAAMAVRCINESDAARVSMTYGTPYHVGKDTDWEKSIATDVGGTISGHAWLDVNGLVFDVKHKIGASQVPHGRHTASARERLWNLLWAEQDGAPRADVFLRSHVHYFSHCGGAGWLAMTLPGLQGPGCKYGERQCSGTVDFGLVHFDVAENGRYAWETHILRVQAAKPRPILV